MSKRSIHFLVLGLTALLFSGCTNTLETGYTPRKLGATTAQRRAFYALPFTAEARAAQMERDAELESRRPRPGY